MKLLFLSVRMFVLGVNCDLLIRIIDIICDYRIIHKKELNTKLIVKLSNLSDRSLMRWQKIENKFIYLAFLK